MIRTLATEYDKKKYKIKKRLREFTAVWSQPERRIFSELCFCICTPQSKAVYCDRAISGMERSGVLFSGSSRQIKSGLKSVRFPNNKARYIAETRKIFTTKQEIKIKDRIDTSDIPETRRWFARNIKGIGLKEASHFLRNIGFGKGLAILDVHILRNMVKYGLIKTIPRSITEKRYLFLEDKLRKFSKKIDIPMEELDLLLWSAETGEIFK
jgi:N-glycosylase/DNA lyase